MASYFPEGNTTLASDSEQRSLQKWNSILFDAVPTSFAGFPEGAEPLASDDEKRSLIKITALIKDDTGQLGPSFFPERGTPNASDDPKRSLIKIASLLGQTALASDSEQKSLQRISSALNGSAGSPSFLPEGGVTKSSDSPQRSLQKIVALEAAAVAASGAAPTERSGSVTLEADDGTWHNVALSGTGENVILNVEQDAVANPLWRACFVHQTDGDFAHYKVGIEVGVDGDYVMKTPELTDEDFDYRDSDPIMLTSIDDAGVYPVSVYLSPEGPVVSVLTLPSDPITDLDGSLTGDPLVVTLSFTETEANVGGLILEVFRSRSGGPYVGVGSVVLGTGSFVDEDPDVVIDVNNAEVVLYKLRYTNTVGNGPYSNIAQIFP